MRAVCFSSEIKLLAGNVLKYQEDSTSCVTSSVLAYFIAKCLTYPLILLIGCFSKQKEHLKYISHMQKKNWLRVNPLVPDVAYLCFLETENLKYKKATTETNRLNLYLNEIHLISSSGWDFVLLKNLFWRTSVNFEGLHFY